MGQTVAAHMAERLPAGFVHLKDADASILQDIRYAGGRNVLGRRLSGYENGACILRAPAAQALARVQAALAKEQLSLLVFDCYRPMRAVRDLAAYVGARHGRRFSVYHPRIARQRLIAEGYIGAHSLHTTGNAVDLTVISVTGFAPRISASQPCAVIDHPLALPMGTSFDCFDALSGGPGRDAQIAANRTLLRQAMEAEGFQAYAREWWHFTFPAQSEGDNSPQDFPVR